MKAAQNEGSSDSKRMYVGLYLCVCVCTDSLLFSMFYISSNSHTHTYTHTYSSLGALSQLVFKGGLLASAFLGGNSIAGSGMIGVAPGMFF